MCLIDSGQRQKRTCSLPAVTDDIAVNITTVIIIIIISISSSSSGVISRNISVRCSRAIVLRRILKRLEQLLHCSLNTRTQTVSIQLQQLLLKNKLLRL